MSFPSKTMPVELMYIHQLLDAGHDCSAYHCLGAVNIDFEVNSGVLGTMLRRNNAGRAGLHKSVSGVRGQGEGEDSIVTLSPLLLSSC